MKRLFLHISVATTVMLAPAGLAFNAHAQSADTVQTDTPHFYGGVSYERLSVDVGPKIKFNSVLLRGGYRFSDYFGAEAELGKGFGTDTTRIGSADVKFKSGVTAGIYGVGYLPLADGFDLVGRLGYKKVGVKASSGASNVKAKGSGFAWSVGAQYYFTQNDGIRLDYQQASGGKAKAITLGYQRKF